MRRFFPLLVLLSLPPLAACRAFSRGARQVDGSSAAVVPFAPPPTEVVPADANAQRELWALLFDGWHAGQVEEKVLRFIFDRDRLEWKPGPKPAAVAEARVVPAPARLGVVVLEEDPAGGARAGEFTVEVRTAADAKAPWRQVASGAGVGARKVVRLADVGPVAALRVRFKGEPPALARLSAHAVPARVAVQPAVRDFLDSTLVRFACDRPDAVVRYTLDGSAPTPASPRYDPARPPEVSRTAEIRAAAEEAGEMSPLVDSAKVVAWDKARLRQPESFALEPERGLAYACYEGVDSLDALRRAEPVFAGICAAPAAHARQARSAEVCEGFLKVDADGLYTVRLRGAAARVWVGGEQVVANDAPRPAEGNPSPDFASGIVALRAGWHPVRFAWLGDKAPEIRITGPGFPADGKVAPERWGR